MEIIAILSAIILVATISTFILAIGAYILYKVRERKREHLKEEYKREVNAEIVAPAYPPNEEINKSKIETEEIKSVKEKKSSPLGEEIDLPSKSKSDEEKISSNKEEKEKVEDEKEKNIKYWKLIKQKESRFLKFTNEGYVPAGDKDKGSIKWR